MKLESPFTDEKASDLGQVTKSLIDVLEQGLTVIKEISERPMEVGSEVVKVVEEKGKEAIEKGTEAAKQHPVVTLLIAFGLGFLLVKLLKRK